MKGFDHKLGAFLEKILTRILTFSVGEGDDQSFAAGKDAVLDIIVNTGQSQPHEMADRVIRQLFLETRWTPGDLLDAMEGRKISQFSKSLGELHKSCNAKIAVEKSRLPHNL